MSIEAALTFGILLMAVFFFVTEFLRADLVALLVLVLLVITGLVTPEESISGFSNPAVVTIWAVFVLSAGLSRTGLAVRLAEQVLRLAGSGESRLLALLMSSSAALSAFVVNVGVVAMFLPVTMNIARRTGRSPSRLLMPMVYATTVGGMLILIGTSSNLVVIDFLREEGLRPPGLFDFTPVGSVILLVSIAYMLLLGHRLLPDRKTPSVDNISPDRDFREQYELQERFAMISIPAGNPLAGKTLAESRFGRALGLNILSVIRDDEKRHVPRPDLSLEEGDRLLVLGRLDILDELTGRPVILIADETPESSCLLSEEIGLAEVEVEEGSIFNGKTLLQLDARKKLGVNLLGIRRKDRIRRTNLHDFVFRPGDRLLFRGPYAKLQSLQEHVSSCEINGCDPEEYNLAERLLYLEIPEGSPLAESSIRDMRLARAYDITVLNIIRSSEEIYMPEPEEIIKENDLLVVEGKPLNIEVLRGHQSLLIDRNPAVDLRELESNSHTVVEVMLSPHTSLIGKTLRQLNFREKFGLSVLAVWRGERAYRTNFNDMPLELGDALLCYGSPERFEMLSRERDFVILNLDYREKPLFEKAPLAGLIMAAVMAVVILDWMPIYVAAIAGSLMMIISRCLTAEEAYRAIEWKAVFLIAAMLPLGLAMQRTGAAAMIAGAVVQAAGPYGPTAILAGLMLLTLFINQIVPSAVNAVVMTPIAIAAAASLGVSPYPFVMAIAYAVAASFMTPVSHPANVMVMSPGGYRFFDYMKNGLPFSLIVLLVSVLLLPLVFPY